ncbi:uncharacterized protein LOC122814935 [Protopterus annectens]|uniref:uncharacterized protein LOC122814935 n=1 Tax=Protopterus annectens TaxID=7888 RepID=UPI001CFB9A76|nr:uncharacterized protein LOC122814935 [Protopterus annectens]
MAPAIRHRLHPEPWNSLDVKVEGESNLSARLPKTARDPEYRKRDQKVGSKVRALTARPDLATGTFLARDSFRKNKEKVHAHTATGKVSPEVPPAEKYSTNELIILIHEKMNSSSRSIQQLFRANDPKGEGVVSKLAMTRILWKICGYLTSSQENKLLYRLGLDEHKNISYEDFFSCFQNKKINRNEWINPIIVKELGSAGVQNKTEQPKANRKDNANNEQGWETIKEKVTKRTGENIASEIHTTLLSKHLGFPYPDNQKYSETLSNVGRLHSCTKNSHFERFMQLLKGKLNEACLSLLLEFNSFEQQDGLVSRADFRNVLKKLKIPMRAMELEHLLAKFNLRRKDGKVDYAKFVEKIKSRSSLSLLQNTMNSQNLRFNRRPFTSFSEGLTAFDAQIRLLEHCQGLFLKLLASFQ